VVAACFSGAAFSATYEQPANMTHVAREAKTEFIFMRGSGLCLDVTSGHIIDRDRAQNPGSLGSCAAGATKGGGDARHCCKAARVFFVASCCKLSSKLYIPIAIICGTRALAPGANDREGQRICRVHSAKNLRSAGFAATRLREQNPCAGPHTHSIESRRAFKSGGA